MLSLALTALFGVASMLATGLYGYCALRLLTGFAIGGNLPLAVSIASELLPPSLRERGVVALQLFNEVRTARSKPWPVATLRCCCSAADLAVAARPIAAMAGCGGRCGRSR